MPGTDPWEAARIVAGELAELPHLPELPARGPGADMIGRALWMLTAVAAEFAAETTVTGWRMAGRVSAGAGRDMRRAQSWLGEDADAFESALASGAAAAVAIKIQICGPWTLAASVEAAGGARLLGDRGACAALGHGLAEVAREQIADLTRRLRPAAIIVQLDEPALPGVLAGNVPTQSGLSRIAAVDAQLAQSVLAVPLAAVTAAGALAAVHCCGPNPPYRLLRQAGARLISTDASQHRPEADDELGGLLESPELAWLAGAFDPIARAARAPGRDQPDDPKATLRELNLIFDRLGLVAGSQPAGLVITPSCGLAGLAPSEVRRAYAACTLAARALRGDRASG